MIIQVLIWCQTFWGVGACKSLFVLLHRRCWANIGSPSPWFIPRLVGPFQHFLFSSRPLCEGNSKKGKKPTLCLPMRSWWAHRERGSWCSWYWSPNSAQCNNVTDGQKWYEIVQWMKWWPMIVCKVHIICGTHMVHDSTQSTHHFDDEWWVPRTKRQQDSGGSHPFKSIRVLAANKMSFHLHTCGRIRNECDLMISLLLFLESLCQDLGVEWPISFNLVLCAIGAQTRNYFS